MILTATPLPGSAPPTTRTLVARTAPYARAPGLGDFGSIIGAIASPLASVFGTLFGGGSKSSSERRMYDYQSYLAELEASYRTQQTQAQERITDKLITSQDAASVRETAAYERGLALQMEALKQRANIERASARDQYDAQTESVRIWRKAQADAASSDLAMQTQSGIYSLAGQGLESTVKVATSLPKTATTTMALIVIGVAVAYAWGGKKPKGPARGKAAAAPATTS